jgi:plastocyanin
MVRIASICAVACVALATAPASSSSVAAHAGPRRSHVVDIKAMGFSKARIDAVIGDTVVFRNADMLSHTATAAGVFDTKEIKPGATSRWVVKKKGTFHYICTFHPVMKAVLVVR